MELQFHGISLSADQTVSLRRKPSIMKVAVVTAPPTRIRFEDGGEGALELQEVAAPSFGRTSAGGQNCACLRGKSAVPSIVLKKSFWGDERNFLELLIRFERGDVRDHIDSSKIDHGPS
jgi:hypothetical protein